MKFFFMVFMGFSVIFMFSISTSEGMKQLGIDTREANVFLEKTIQNRTKSSYFPFVKENSHQSKNEIIVSSEQVFRITLVDKAPATLDRKSLEGKELTFLFVDVVAQSSDATGSGKQKDLFAVFKENRRSPIQAVLHWSKEDVIIDMEGGMVRKNGGSFIHTEPLKEYPGHPVSFPTESGWYTYKFKRGGKIRLGLFFEGNADKMESLNIFGKIVDLR